MPRSMPDVVVLLPGITGSVLRKDGREVWGTSGGALLRTLISGGGSIRDLAFVDDNPDADDTGDGVTVAGLAPDLTIIPGLWKIDGYTKVARVLGEVFELVRGKNYFEFAYDWRRDNRASARRLARESHDWLGAWRQESGNRDARLVLVAHSMGGIISRYFLEALEGWKKTRSLITFGTPYRGSLNALNFLANGYGKSLGPLRMDLSPMLRSLTSIYQLLPIYECVATDGQGLKRVAEAGALPNVDSARAAQALAFHRSIETAQAANAADEAYKRDGYRTYPIVGIDQPTLQSARLDGGGSLEMLATYEGEDLSGDGTVPRVSATPIELSKARREMFAAERHGSLQNFDAVLSQVEGVVSGDRIDLGRFRTAAPGLTTLGLAIDDAFATDEPVRMKVRPSEGRPELWATIADAETRAEIRRVPLRAVPDGFQSAEIPPLRSGFYRVTVSGGERISPVTDVFAVLG